MLRPLLFFVPILLLGLVLLALHVVETWVVGEVEQDTFAYFLSVPQVVKDLQALHFKSSDQPSKISIDRELCKRVFLAGYSDGDISEMLQSSQALLERSSFTVDDSGPGMWSFEYRRGPDERLGFSVKDKNGKQYLVVEYVECY